MAIDGYFILMNYYFRMAVMFLGHLTKIIADILRSGDALGLYSGEEPCVFFS